MMEAAVREITFAAAHHATQRPPQLRRHCVVVRWAWWRVRLHSEKVRPLELEKPVDS
jgi:hypothetical protein